MAEQEPQVTVSVVVTNVNGRSAIGYSEHQILAGDRIDRAVHVAAAVAAAQACFRLRA